MGAPTAASKTRATLTQEKLSQLLCNGTPAGYHRAYTCISKVPNSAKRELAVLLIQLLDSRKVATPADYALEKEILDKGVVPDMDAKFGILR